ncbi:SGNH hydrolase [Pyrenochaeta sp. DS3sAY3a]|nr:SGNH hydrolase [Pyrenochaeta sp. DS3sAY3a]
MRMRCIALPLFVAVLPEALAYPQSLDDTNFVFGAIGDSWASGVSYSKDTEYNGDPTCSRLIHAWSTVVDARYSEWAPDKNKKPQFEFKACAGARMENMMEQMDQLTRPKIVFMEVSGNDADFYPMADACLFHQYPLTTYGPRFEDDDRNEPKGLCMKEVKLVRDRIENAEFQKKYHTLIDNWRAHKAVVGNDATLFVHGYPWFFGPAMDDYCEKSTFQIAINPFPAQYLVKSLRLEFNTLIDIINGDIKRAVESFNDPKIQWIDINPAFDGHRFCEPGHTDWDQHNTGDKVWIWNAPGRWSVTVWNGKETHSYDSATDKLPQDLIDKVIDHPDGPPERFPDTFIQGFQNPAFPDLRVEYKLNKIDPSPDTQGPELLGSGGSGSKFRTLHPRQQGHSAMADKIIKRLQTYYGTVGAPGPCPAGCDCSAGVPRCT